MNVGFLFAFITVSIINIQSIDEKIIWGKWKSIRVDYLDRKPALSEEGLNLVFEFKKNGMCINHEHESAVPYSISGRTLDMAGYKVIIEKLTEKELVFREQKDFFVRRFYCKKMIE